MLKKRILIITEAGQSRPSGWVRALIYSDLFKKRNIHVDYTARQSPWLNGLLGRKGILYNRLLNAGIGNFIGRLGLVISRVREYLIIQRAKNNYDVIYIQKAGSYKLVIKLRRIHKGLLVFDLNDGLWLPANANYAEGKIREILSLVDAVTCDNPYGLDFARSFNKKAFLVADPAQVELFDQFRDRGLNINNPLVIGWIGGPSSLFNLFSIWEALEIVFSRHKNLILRLVGTGYDSLLLPRFEKVQFSCLPYYSQLDMVHEVLQMDIGLFPLFDVEDSLARGILKGAIYMSGEVAVIASPRGQVCAIIQDGVNGMLANSTEEWVTKLEQLITDSELRQRIAAAGLETVRRNFTIDKTFQELMKALEILPLL